MKDNSHRIFIITGLLLIAVALFLVGFNIRQGMYASIRSGEILDQIEFGRSSLGQVQAPEMELPVTEIDGIPFIGALEIPSLGLQLPVAAYWDESFALSAPCKYSGSPYAGDIIIAGHNYRRHFGQLRALRAGDEVYFTSVNGESFVYQVASLENVDGIDVTGMKTGADIWDLTLFTCNFSGWARVAVRCIEIE